MPLAGLRFVACVFFFRFMFRLHSYTLLHENILTGNNLSKKYIYNIKQIFTHILHTFKAH